MWHDRLRRIDARLRLPIVLALLSLYAAACAAVIAGGDHSPAATGEASAPRSPSWADVPPADTPQEEQVRALETQALGPAHAAQHAMARALAGREKSVSGSTAPPRSGASPAKLSSKELSPAEPAQTGRWTPKFAIPSVAVHAVMLPTGKILYFTGASASHAYLLDPVTQTTENVDPPALPGQTAQGSIFCAGQSLLADGRVLIVGGTLGFRVGVRTVLTFDPFTKTWNRQPDMRHGRWYPTSVLLADGRTAILDGLDERGQPFENPDVEVYDAASDTVGLASVRGTAGQPPTGGLYPHMFVMPSGRVLVAGPRPEDSWFLEAGSDGGLTWDDAPDLSIRRTWASGVLLPGGVQGSTRVELIGGADYESLTDSGSSAPLATTEVFDERNPAAGWSAGAPLNVARAHQNTVLLPDGSMATVGGGYGILDGKRGSGDPAVHRQIELYDRATDSWRLGPAQDELRAYHSTALLLPDGRVLSAGDDTNGGPDTDTAEIYEPPYLFKGARPAIESVPETIDHGFTFMAGTHDHVTRAVLMAPGADTHANDMNQRYVRLKLAQRRDGRGVNLTAPPSPSVAPPGYYMLFLLGDDGVPSVARFVRLTVPARPPVIEAAPAAPLSLDEVSLAVTHPDQAIREVRWDLDADGSFDDGSASQVSTSFATPGTHLVRARVTYEGGASTVAERRLAIGNRAPTANLVFAPTAATSLQAVRFTVDAADADGTIVSEQWDLDGDGSFDDGEGTTVTASFPRKGDYTVSVRVADDFGAGSVSSVVVPVSNTPPVASFDFSPASPVALRDVAFRSTSTDADGTPALVEWDTDADGAFDATGDTLTRAFASAGTYDIALRVTDNDGDSATVSRSVVVGDELDELPGPGGTGSPTGMQPHMDTPLKAAAPAHRVLTRGLARTHAEDALARRYGRRYEDATSRRLWCERRSPARLRCRYSFRSAGARPSGRVEVVLRSSGVATVVKPDRRPARHER
jgi:PKD repeat protein